jgi:tetratricopeptide (TPR) repeat protein
MHIGGGMHFGGGHIGGGHFHGGGGHFSGGNMSGFSSGAQQFGGARLGNQALDGTRSLSFSQHHAFSLHGAGTRTSGNSTFLGSHNLTAAGNAQRVSAVASSATGGHQAGALLAHSGTHASNGGQFLATHPGSSQTALANHTATNHFGRVSAVGHNHFGGAHQGSYNNLGFRRLTGLGLYGYGYGQNYYWINWLLFGLQFLYGYGGYGYGNGYGYGGYGSGGYGYGYNPCCAASNGYGPAGYGYPAMGNNNDLLNDRFAAGLAVDPLTNGLALNAPLANGQVTANNTATNPANNPKPATKDAQNAKVFAEKGENDFRARDYKDAVYAWRHALTDDPNNGVLIMMLSQGFLATGQYDEAAGTAQQAMQLLPKREWGIVVKNFRELYGNAQDYTTQMRALESAVKDKPNDPALRFLTGFHYAFLGYPKEAVYQLDKGLQAAPRDEMAKKLRDEMAAKLPKPIDLPAPPRK